MALTKCSIIFQVILNSKMGQNRRLSMAVMGLLFQIYAHNKLAMLKGNMMHAILVQSFSSKSKDYVLIFMLPRVGSNEKCIKLWNICMSTDTRQRLRVNEC